MTLNLTDQEVQRYQSDGLLFPKHVISPKQASACLDELERYEATTGRPINGKFRYKCHLLFPWINELMRDETILDIVEDLIGPDIMVWTTHLYPKEAGDGRFISWHQDSAHWGLDSEKILTVWVALTAANRENGCMKMLPGSQTTGTVEHKDTWDDNNILTRGQTITKTVDESQTVYVELQPGEASIHHLFMWHASEANVSETRRVAVALRYITPSTRQMRADTDYATLVRGTDSFGHFRPEPRPDATMDPAFLRLHEEITNIQGAIYLSGTKKAGIQGLADPTRASPVAGPPALKVENIKA